jgi:hypothetical protein
VHAITVDVTGGFPVQGFVANLIQYAYWMMKEDILLPSDYLDDPSFGTPNQTLYPYVGGVYFDPSQNVDGATAVNMLLNSFGAKLVPTRDGKLQLFVLRALSSSATPVGVFSEFNTVSIVPKTLPAALDPPPFRVRVGYQHNYTVQASDINATTPSDRVQFIAAADRYRSSSSNAILTAYKRPNDLSPVGGSLGNPSDAQTVADALITLWGIRRRLYLVTVPMSIGLALDLGDVVSLIFPLDDLSGGKAGQIVGEMFTSSSATIIFQVLV